MIELTKTYDLKRAAALWPIEGEGEQVARCLHQALKEHAQHKPCERFACIQDRTIDLAYEPGPEGHDPLWWAATSNSLLPMIEDFRQQVREAREESEPTS